jgi:hypothetical protein
MEQPGQRDQGGGDLASQDPAERPHGLFQASGGIPSQAGQLPEVDLPNGGDAVPIAFSKGSDRVGLQLPKAKEAVEKVDGRGLLVQVADEGPSHQPALEGIGGEWRQTPRSGRLPLPLGLGRQIAAKKGQHAQFIQPDGMQPSPGPTRQACALMQIDRQAERDRCGPG